MTVASEAIDPGVLVCDFSEEGHRATNVRVFGQALGAATLIAPFRAAIGPVLRARVVLFATFETAPAPMLLLTMLRSLAGRATRLILLRPVIDGQGWRSRVKRAMHALMVRLPGVRAMTLMEIPPASPLSGRAFVIQDPQYWDAGGGDPSVATPLSDAVLASANGRKIMVATGGIDPQKGMGLIADMMRAPDWPKDALHIAIIGKTSGSARDDVDRIEAAGGFAEDRYLSDQEIFSLYGIAACIWCCYPPDRDMASGIFGRARQFGVWPIVREGSMLDRECRSDGFGTAVPWDDAARAAKILAAMVEGGNMAMARSGADAAVEIARLRAVMFDAAPPATGR